MKQSFATTLTIVVLGFVAAASHLFAPVATLVAIGSLLGFAELSHAFTRRRAERGSAAPDSAEHALLLAMLVTSSTVLLCLAATIGSGRSELFVSVPFLLVFFAAVIRDARPTRPRLRLVPVAGWVLLAVVWIAEDRRGASETAPVVTASSAVR